LKPDRPGRSKKGPSGPSWTGLALLESYIPAIPAIPAIPGLQRSVDASIVNVHKNVAEMSQEPESLVREKVRIYEWRRKTSRKIYGPHVNYIVTTYHGISGTHCWLGIAHQRYQTQEHS
jgi:hypothetical protein